MKATPAAPPSPPAQPPLSLVKAAFSGPALWLSLALIAVNVVVYAPVAHHEFLNWDDPEYVTDNPHIQGGLTWHGVVWAFTTDRAANWHPLTWLSIMLDVEVHGMSPGGHHLTSLLLHIASTILLFGVLHQMTGARDRSAFVAALFAVHPLHVESVAWVAERKDVLSTLFAMLTLVAYVAYVRRPQSRRYVPVLLFYTLGLMAKPMLVTLPFALLLLDIWPLGRAGPRGVGEPSVWLKRVKEKLPMLVLAVASSVVTFLLQQRGGTVAKLEGVPFGLRLANALVSYVTYVGKMLWPSSLAALYPYPRSIPPWWVGAAALLLVGVSLAAIRAMRRRPYLFVGWFWYLGTLVPVIGLVQVGPQSMADRYTYIPLLGLLILVAWLVPDLPLQPRLRANALRAVAVGVIVAYAICARVYLPHWRNSTALWHRVLEVTHDNYLAHDNLGVALADQGKLTEAIVHFSEALRIKPGFANTHYNFGVVLADQGKLTEAIVHFSEALRTKPDFANAHDSLGTALARQGRLAEAVAHFSEAVRIRPDFASAHNDLGVALAEQGKLAEAVAHFSEALRLEPENADAHYGLGAALARQGKLEEAIREFREALRIEPNAPEYHYNLGLVLQKKRQTGEAALQFEEALRLNPKHEGARQRLNLTRQGRGSDRASPQPVGTRDQSTRLE